MELKYFKPTTDPLMVGVDNRVMLMLDSAHDLHPSVPYVITCGVRTVDQNCRLKGAVPNSAHETGLAVDLACPEDQALFAMIEGLIHAGFMRIGVYIVRDPQNPNVFRPRHIHVDADETKPQGVFFIYAEQN